MYDPDVDALGLELLAVQSLLDIERDGIDEIRVPRPGVGRMRWGFGFDGQRVSVVCQRLIGDGESRLSLLGVLHGRHGLPVGVLDDLAGVFHATAQRRNTGLKALVNGGQANELLAEGRGVAQTEQHGMIVAVNLHVAGQDNRGCA